MPKSQTVPRIRRLNRRKKRANNPWDNYNYDYERRIHDRLTSDIRDGLPGR